MQLNPLSRHTTAAAHRPSSASVEQIETQLMTHSTTLRRLGSHLKALVDAYLDHVRKADPGVVLAPPATGPSGSTAPASRLLETSDRTDRQTLEIIDTHLAALAVDPPSPAGLMKKETVGRLILRGHAIAHREGLGLVNPVTDYINALVLTISPAHWVDIRHQAIVDEMSIQILADAFLHFALLKSTEIAAVA